MCQSKESGTFLRQLKEEKMRIILPFLGVLLLLCCTGAMAKTLFFDDFEDGVIDEKWDFTGNWEETDGYLACVESNVKFNYAIPEIPAEFHSEQITIQAKGKIIGAPWTRMGVAVRLMPRLDNAEARDGKPTGHLGYCLTTGENGPSDVRLLNEGVQWVNLNTPVRPQLDQWVWVQLTVTAEQELMAKVWLDGEEEPINPTGNVNQWSKKDGTVVEPNRPDGPAGLVGKALEAWERGGATPAYDEVEIWDADGRSERSTAVESTGKLSLTWGKLKAL